MSLLVAFAVILTPVGGANADTLRDVGSPSAVASWSFDGSLLESEYAFQVFLEINRIRAAHGVGELRVDPRLNAQSWEWSSRMRAERNFRHSGLPVGENIGYSSGFVTPKAMIDAWVASPGHFANLLSPDYQFTGVGISVGDEGVYATQQFEQ